MAPVKLPKIIVDTNACGGYIHRSYHEQL